MTQMNLTESILTCFDDPAYARLAVARAESYRSAKPFPYAVFDDFLPVPICQALHEQFPPPDDRCKFHNNANTSRRFQDDASKFGPALRLFSQVASSREFLLFLETLSGINCLIPDPYLIGGGAMMSGDGDFLKVHQDFNWHHKLQVHRRLNALLYLTPDWQPEYGGDLELWNESERVVAIAPTFNRLVVFNTPDANHGQPHPLRTPPGVYRRVLSFFYYTTRANEDVWKDPHFTKYLPENSRYGEQLTIDYEARGRS
jgi:hypothetical protein